MQTEITHVCEATMHMDTSKRLRLARTQTHTPLIDE